MISSQVGAPPWQASQMRPSGGSKEDQSVLSEALTQSVPCICDRYRDFSSTMSTSAGRYIEVQMMSAGGDSLSVANPAPRRWAFRVGILQWMVGLYCGLVGAMALVAPHQLLAPVTVRAASLAQLFFVGSFLFVVGFALAVIPVLGASRRVIVAV